MAHSKHSTNSTAKFKYLKIRRQWMHPNICIACLNVNLSPIHPYTCSSEIHLKPKFKQRTTTTPRKNWMQFRAFVRLAENTEDCLQFAIYPLHPSAVSNFHCTWCVVFVCNAYLCFMSKQTRMTWMSNVKHLSIAQNLLQKWARSLRCVRMAKNCGTKTFFVCSLSTSWFPVLSFTFASDDWGILHIIN